MKKAIYYVMMLFLIFTGWSSQHFHPADVGQDRQALSDTGSMTQPQVGLTNLQDGRIHPLIEDAPSLHPLCEEFLSTSRELFLSRHDPITLWEQGFSAAPLLPGYTDGPIYGWLKILRVNQSCREPVIGTVRMGDDLTGIVSLLGEPHFTNRERDEDEFLLTGYRFADFYIVIFGERVIEEITIVGDTGIPGPDANELLNDFNTTGNPDELLKTNKTPAYRVFHERNYWVYYINGLHLSNNKTIVFLNYEGDIYLTMDESAYTFIDDDSMFYLQRQYYRDRINQSVHSSGPSPNGNQVVLAGLSNRPVDGDSFYIHFLDGSKPDIQVYTMHIAEDHIWLTDRYLLYTVAVAECSFLFDIETEIVIPLLKNRMHELNEMGFFITSSREDDSYVLRGGVEPVMLSPSYVFPDRDPDAECFVHGK